MHLFFYPNRKIINLTLHPMVHAHPALPLEHLTAGDKIKLNTF